jgi:L-serine/L-threonine ammonia-lyase
MFVETRSPLCVASESHFDYFFYMNAGLPLMNLNSQVYLKLENLQPSGSFKSRGIGSFMVAHLQRHLSKNPNFSGVETTNSPPIHYYIASGGNAGLGCVHAAVTMDSLATVVVPLSTTEDMISKLRTAGATDVIQHGESWAEADAYLKNELVPATEKRGEKAVYIPPFDAPEIWDGNAGIVREIYEQISEIERHYPHPYKAGEANGEDTDTPKNITPFDAIVCSVGGGGLFCGIMQGLEERGAETTKVFAVETLGAESLSQAIEKRQLVTLPRINSIATSLGARTVCKKALEYGLRESVISVVVTDKDAVEACQRFANEERLLVEPACGVCAAVCYKGILKKACPELRPESKIVIVVCGGSNVSLDSLEKYAKQFGMLNTSQ